MPRSKLKPVDDSSRPRSRADRPPDTPAPEAPPPAPAPARDVLLYRLGPSVVMDDGVFRVAVPHAEWTTAWANIRCYPASWEFADSTGRPVARVETLLEGPALVARFDLLRSHG